VFRFPGVLRFSFALRNLSFVDVFELSGSFEMGNRVLVDSFW
jgi:hypothetical protein